LDKGLLPNAIGHDAGKLHGPRILILSPIIMPRFGPAPKKPFGYA
jgi:hypothetical protein